jgi:hypothetical protein
VAQLAEELWGQGKVVTGKSPEQVLGEKGVGQDFAAPPSVRWIHRKAGETEIYFVASNSPQAREATCVFRAEGLRPELWRPETGEIEPVAVYEQTGGMTRIPIAFEPSGSVFVVFRPAAGKLDAVVGVSLDGKPLAPPAEPKALVQVERAVYGVPGDRERTRDVKAKLQALLDAGEYAIGVSRLAAGDDPAYGVVKTLDADYSFGGTSQGDCKDSEMSTSATPAGATNDGKGWLVETEGRTYELKLAGGRALRVDVSAIPAPPIWRPLELRPPKGAPEPTDSSRRITAIPE